MKYLFCMVCLDWYRNLTKPILLDSLLQEVVVTLPHLCVADNTPEATDINTDAMPYRSAVE